MPDMRTELEIHRELDQRNFVNSIDQSPNDADLELAILWTLAYADVFDYPLTIEQIYRFLIGRQISYAELQSFLDRHSQNPSQVNVTSGYYTLAGRESIVETRSQRAQYSARLWDNAIFYGNLFARLPFVRMVAVTGALAMNNALPGDDIDYLIVTLPGRLWLCRAMVIALVRLAALRGDVICPNYFLSERATFFSQRNLYAAHELVQMVPLSGLKVYKQIRERNKWTRDFLPNAEGQPREILPGENGQDQSRYLSIAESPAFSFVASWLENWEMTRKVRRFQNQTREGAEVSFCADWCKGHFDGHGKKTINAFLERLHTLGIADSPRLWSDR